MSTGQQQRPSFFEGQYLGATDLNLAVEYNRFQQARHALGAHTWGIAAGLELKEQEAAGGGVDVIVQPGFAIDGYGRQIVVREPYKLSPELFASITGGTNSVRVKLWIRFYGEETQSPNDLYKVCDSEDQFARLQEGFRIAVAREGTFAPEDVHDDITVAGQSLDAIDAPPSREKTDPLHCDESVPYQTFPDTEQDAERVWLVPLGCVRWNISNQRLEESQNESTKKEDERHSRRFRRYIGAVAEDVFAADGLIRLRSRKSDPPADETTGRHAACEALLLHPDEGHDLTTDPGPDAKSIDLVWIEGDLRLIGDEKIYGGKLDFRQQDGATNETPLWIQRVDPNKLGGKDLQAIIGDSSDGRNRLAVGPRKEKEVSNPDGSTQKVQVLDEKLVVLDNGHVGIQVPAPEVPEHDLQIGVGEEQASLALRGLESDEKSSVLAFEDKNGTASGWMQFVYNTLTGRLVLGSAVLDPDPIATFVATSGHVGIGTNDPWRPLTIRGKGNGEELIGFEGIKPDGTVDRKWHINQRLGGVRDGLNFAETGVKDGRLFLKAGGKVGINTVNPDVAFHIEGGNDVALSDGRGYLMLGVLESLNIVMDDNEIQARNNRAAADLHLQAEGGDLTVHILAAESSVFRVRDDGRVGVGTDGPRDKLEVRGNIRLAADGNDFAVSSKRSAVRIVAGRVSEDGIRQGGDDFDANTRIAEGRSRVIFGNPFVEVPSVVVTAVNASNNDHVATIVTLQSNLFEVVIKDVLTGDADNLRNTAFTFMAIGGR